MTREPEDSQPARNCEPLANSTSTFLDKVRRAYTGVAVVILSTIILFLILNVVAALVLALGGGLLQRESGSLSYPMNKLTGVYPGWQESDIRSLLTETWSREYQYRPFVQHMEVPQQGRYVNIDPAGFRLGRDQGPWPPDPTALNVFAFGGSTTFGYGVPDWETIPSFLQEKLTSSCGRQVFVYNFGTGNFYSEQERSLFESLLSQGFRSDVVTFLDGLNEWKEEPKMTRRLERLMRETDARLVKRALKVLPLTRLAIDLRSRQVRPAGASEGPALSPVDKNSIIDRWIRNRRLIAAAAEEFGILPFFFWQPIPAYGYDLRFHVLYEKNQKTLDLYQTLSSGYDAMNERRQADPRFFEENSLVWLADMQKTRQEALYVDVGHYTAAFSGEIAHRMASILEEHLGCTAKDLIKPLPPETQRG